MLHKCWTTIQPILCKMCLVSLLSCVCMCVEVVLGGGGHCHRITFQTLMTFEHREQITTDLIVSGTVYDVSNCNQEMLYLYYEPFNKGRELVLKTLRCINAVEAPQSYFDTLHNLTVSRLQHTVLYVLLSMCVCLFIRSTGDFFWGGRGLSDFASVNHAHSYSAQMFSWIFYENTNQPVFPPFKRLIDCSCKHP